MKSLFEQEIEKTAGGSLPLADAAAFFISVRHFSPAVQPSLSKTAGWQDPPDETGELEGQFSLPLEQVVHLMGQCATTLPVEWEASRSPRLFPVMKAEVSVYPITATETQIDFHGSYDPPMGALGTAMNAVAGHRIAEASVHRFVRDVATYLRETIA